MFVDKKKSEKEKDPDYEIDKQTDETTSDEPDEEQLPRKAKMRTPQKGMYI